MTVTPCGGGWCLHLLGGFQLDIASMRLPLGHVEERLVAFLALQGRAVRRELVAVALWPDADGTRAAASLRTAVWRLRRQAPGLVSAGRDRLGLHDDVTLDLAHAQAVAAHATATGTDAVWLEHDLLPDWIDEWAAIDRERFRQARLHALEATSRALSAAGSHARAIDVATSAISADPLRESAHRVLIEAHLSEGNRSEALRQYDRFARLLAEELGLRPTGTLAELVGRAPRPQPEATLRMLPGQLSAR